MKAVFLVVCGVQLSRKIVQNIHLEGGSLLGVSRGGARTTDIVDSIEVSSVMFLMYCLLLLATLFESCIIFYRKRSPQRHLVTNKIFLKRVHFTSCHWDY